MDRIIKTLKKAMQRGEVVVREVDEYLCDKGFFVCDVGTRKLIYETPDTNGYICVTFECELGIPIVNDVYSICKGGLIHG